ncbi:hypothetical protein Adt_45768 [Abeliophyllum distichum]|uniref:Uncharacterized protein n=1 Tax=Abeliophyllum distichum TaxID=126358 RepID=A0ABD1PEL2_9LAMI
MLGIFPHLLAYWDVYFSPLIREKLDPTMMEPLPTSPTIAAASVYKYWTLVWKKAADEASMNDLLQLVEMSLIWGLVLNKEVCSTLTGFEGKFSKEEANSKKLSKDLKVMNIEKAMLESVNRALQFKLDIVVAIDTDLKAKYELKLKTARESLKQARD